MSALEELIGIALGQVGIEQETAVKAQEELREATEAFSDLVSEFENLALFIAYNVYGENANSFRELSPETKKQISEIARTQ